MFCSRLVLVFFSSHFRAFRVETIFFEHDKWSWMGNDYLKRKDVWFYFLWLSAVLTIAFSRLNCLHLYICGAVLKWWHAVTFDNPLLLFSFGLFTPSVCLFPWCFILRSASRLSDWIVCLLCCLQQWRYSRMLWDSRTDCLSISIALGMHRAVVWGTVPSRSISWCPGAKKGVPRPNPNPQCPTCGMGKWLLPFDRFIYVTC